MYFFEVTLRRRKEKEEAWHRRKRVSREENIPKKAHETSIKPITTIPRSYITCKRERKRERRKKHALKEIDAWF